MFELGELMFPQLKHYGSWKRGFPYPNNNSSAVPIGTPNPVHAFQPAPASYPIVDPVGLLFPVMISRVPCFAG